MDLNLKQRVFSFNVGRLLAWIYANGYEVTFGEAYRTPEQQAIYLKEKKTKVATSQHQNRLAIDLNLMKTPKSGYDYISDTNEYKPIGDYWVSLNENNRWGGDWDKDGLTTDEKFHDGNHFEMR
jgi:hypothetical protein